MGEDFLSYPFLLSVCLVSSFFDYFLRNFSLEVVDIIFSLSSKHVKFL